MSGGSRDAFMTADGGLTHTLGMVREEITPQRVVISMPVTPRLHQPTGLLHGGASLALAESAASVAGNLNCAEGFVALGQEINANHLRGISEGTLRATATPVHIGRRSQVWSVDIVDENGKMICVSRVTLAVVPATPIKSAD
ncbi:MAG TPA: hotdog fold thioesterase [Dehalococcoidia bacterium]